MDESNTLDVIAVGAHPDDVEIGCGGTVALLVNQGYKVGIVDLTDGEPTPLSSGPEQRLAEAQAAADKLGVQQRIIMDLPNRRLFDNFEARVELGKIFRKFRPTVVLGLLGKTPLASPDHWQAAQIIDAAIFYSRLSKWDEHFDGLPVHTIQRQVYYSLLGSEFNQTGDNQFVVDISTTLEQKIDSIKCYKSQFPPEKQRVFERVKAMAVTSGTECGFKAGEKLASARTVGSQNLMQTLLVD